MQQKSVLDSPHRCSLQIECIENKRKFELLVRTISVLLIITVVIPLTPFPTHPYLQTLPCTPFLRGTINFKYCYSRPKYYNTSISFSGIDATIFQHSPHSTYAVFVLFFSSILFTAALHLTLLQKPNIERLTFLVTPAIVQTTTIATALIISYYDQRFTPIITAKMP